MTHKQTAAGKKSASSVAAGLCECACFETRPLPAVALIRAGVADLHRVQSSERAVVIVRALDCVLVLVFDLGDEKWHMARVEVTLRVQTLETRGFESTHAESDAETSK